MIKSKYFWLAAVFISLIPILVIDVLQHNFDWQKEVREQLITVVHNLYPFDKQQKTNILDKVFERNRTLMFLIYIKIFIILILALLSFYFLKLYKKQQKPNFLKPFIIIIGLMALFISAKIFIINKVITNKNIKVLTISPDSSTIQQLYNENFKGKVLYIDFWGTTCGPCLQEFRDFTKPLKEKYRTNTNLQYLYIAEGNEYLWKEQIKKYNVEGYHLFVNLEQFKKLYINSTKDKNVYSPRYIIINKKGQIVETNAKRPSESLYLQNQLNKYLNE